jgi:transcription elongation GreA/GreB family factor
LTFSHACCPAVTRKSWPCHRKVCRLALPCEHGPGTPPESILENYELVETEDGDVVGPGKLVTLSIDGDEPETYYLGSREEKFAGAATMTPESALGQAILGRGINETAEYETPNGSKLSVTIISVELP